ncbi:hypothetical protein GP486_004996 [Trichoglossum hirsutum]|uniref:Uncharacterized protein n=1 Tax=Trichoglossum hirsutum TaxID=265104 RepID=A0A9P8RNK6_9PEZI|nr:hypothetical protein GP486_004996 [Trichoglossum hirsutum]
MADESTTRSGGNVDRATANFAMQPQHTDMSVLQTRLKKQLITPPSSFIDPPLTPSPTDKVFTQAPRVIALFRLIKSGRHVGLHPWTEFQLARGEYSEIERRLEQDECLWGFVKDKIRYDYDGTRNRLVVRMPTAVHGLLISGVEDVIRCGLERIRGGSDKGGSDKAALFAQKVWLARSTVIHFPVDDAPPTTRSKHEPDASFWHADAVYPGVIIEVSYSQKRKRLDRLAEEYLLDSNASVRVVVGLDIEYGGEKSRKATLSVWRTHVFHTDDGDELRVVQEIADEAFRDDQGNPTDHPGLRLQLSDFACGRLTEDIGGESQEILLSTQQLCQYLTAAEDKIRKLKQGMLVEIPLPLGVKKRKRSRTP